jgi:membrane-associated phospholipid phosphatase/uncharacterized membrane protein YkvA (DUF1232 family)
MGSAIGLTVWGWTAIAVTILVGVWAVFVGALFLLGRGPEARALARLIPDLIVLFKRLLADRRVPRRAKVVLALGLAYVLSPIDLIPDFIPVAGVLDDAVIVGLTLRVTLAAAGADLVSELWPGPPESLRVVVALSRPRAGPAERRRWWLVLLFGVLAPLALFAVLAEDVAEHEVISWDTSILHFMERHQSDALTTVTRLVTDSGSTASIVLISLAVAALLLIARLRWHALFVAVAVAVTAGLNGVMKVAFERPRPDVFPHLVLVRTWSFPSGHSMDSMGLAVALAIVAWPTRWRWPVLVVGLVWAVAVGVSRLYLGVHYPSDVVAGWALALSTVCVVWLVFWRALSLPGAQAEPARAPSRITSGEVSRS